MSHLTTYNSQLNDIDSIRDFCRELGLTIIEGGSVRHYYSTPSKADYVISWEGTPYDVGLLKNKITGNYDLVYDSYGGHVERKLGKDCCKLKQGATFHKIAKKAKGYGFFITRKDTEKGTTLVTLSR